MTRPIRIYGYFNGMTKDGKKVLVSTITEKGEVLFSYFVKNELTGKRILGMDGKTRNNWERYQAKVGAFTLEWVPFAETRIHPGLKMAVQNYLALGGTPYAKN
jgi:hypothetical protein